ncbi:hypothetical protein [Cesiribacter andamanensis]|nr:hypothetical protein [Cesiribacter andamanensis]
MLFVADTEIAARHALERGYILQEYMKDIIIEKAKDEKRYRVWGVVRYGV